MHCLSHHEIINLMRKTTGFVAVAAVAIRFSSQNRQEKTLVIAFEIKINSSENYFG